MFHLQTEDNQVPMVGHATRAYSAASAHRSLREQEAEVFRRANAALRQKHRAGSQGWVRALADNTRLWTTVLDVVYDPTNQLSPELRAAIVSVGLAVKREMQREQPDIDFLIAVNDNISDGLSGNL